MPKSDENWRGVVEMFGFSFGALGRKTDHDNGARKWAMMGKDDWTPYRAYLRGHLRTSPPLKRSQRPAFVDVKVKFPDRLARCERVKALMLQGKTRLHRG
ncbi:hypothetical protein AVEN_108574-1 [Araneus ventricosus]|uniref:Uncharacterized protein n=1 Tax=Araneus ventricosus TaxID=182803 RepID=A0A4Y2DK44_ARAVE|nr:hypothetical protein AVEN_108574-1 [Araneus ventricosus]